MSASATAGKFTGGCSAGAILAAANGKPKKVFPGPAEAYSGDTILFSFLSRAAELTRDAAERKEFIAAAKAAFSVMDRHVQPDGSATFFNSKATTMLLQGGGRYMLHFEKAQGRRGKGY